jgi:Holliday junction resolvase RusA-like endonuclease
MTFMVTFKVEGEPKGKGRPRFRSTGKFVHAYTDSKTREYENKIKASALVAMGASKPLKSPVVIFIDVVKGIPASYSKKRTSDCLSGREHPTKKPDIDNTMKACLDAMNGIVYVDDKQVVSIHARQSYGEEPHVEIFVKEAGYV